MAALQLELQTAQIEIEALAQSLGLDFFKTIFEMVDYKKMNQIAAYGGFPVRYPHWRFGMEYEGLSKSYEYGLSKIYELVINTDPCIAYLLEGNSIVDQKLVMAHVYGHCDFFKNNYFFSKTNRKMLDQMANHSVRVRRYIDRFGIEEVENFIDQCLSLENLIDRYSVYSEVKDNFEKPSKDILKFLIEKAPIEDWQADILQIIRLESYYFAPQGMTKIMNEGWASYWHAKMMTEHICTDSEIVCFCDTHSGTMAMSPGGMNPYKVGIELFRNIEKRWDQGQFGKEWEDCNNLYEKSKWDRNTGLGRQKIFQVRRDYNDITFLDEFLTEDFCVENKLFVYKQDPKTNEMVIDTSDFKVTKEKLLFQLTNMGQPTITVIEGNFKGQGELLLGHIFEGVELQSNYVNETLKRIYKIWKKPVHLSTVVEKKPQIICYSGEEVTFHNVE